MKIHSIIYTAQNAWFTSKAYSTFLPAGLSSTPPRTLPGNTMLRGREQLSCIYPYAPCSTSRETLFLFYFIIFFRMNKSKFYCQKGGKSMTLKATTVQQFLVFIQLSKAWLYLILTHDQEWQRHSRESPDIRDLQTAITMLQQKQNLQTRLKENRPQGWKQHLTACTFFFFFFKQSQKNICIKMELLGFLLFTLSLELSNGLGSAVGQTQRVLPYRTNYHGA